MNSVILCGRLTKDPEFSILANSNSVCKMNLAVDRDYKGKDNKKITDFFNIVAWGKTGEACANNLAKGREITVLGSIQNRSYENKSKQKVYITEIVAERVKFHGSSSSQSNHQEPDYRVVNTEEDIY